MLNRSKALSYSFNWMTVIFSLYLVVYGYYAALTPKLLPLFYNATLFVATTLGLLSISCLFIYFAQKKLTAFEDSFTISVEDILVFFTLLGFLLIISFKQLNYSLVIDELSYATTAHIHSLKISILSGQHLTFLQDIPLKHIMQFLSICVIVTFVLFFQFLKKISWLYCSLIYSGFFIILRAVIGFFGGNNTVHPPLQYLPPLVTTALFGLNDYAFKLSYFVSFIVLLFSVYKMLQRLFSLHVSFLATLAIATIPLLMHTSTIVEHSLWASLIFIFIVVDLITSEKIHYGRLVSLISIFTMMRQPSFIALVPICILYFWTEFKFENFKQNLKPFIILLIPTLFFIPFILKSIILGTPSTQALEKSNVLYQFTDILTPKIIFASMLLSVSSLWLAFIPFALIPISSVNFKKKISLLLFFFVALVIYYSIHPGLWGEPKYQTEYVIPFAVAGFIFILLSVREHPKFSLSFICIVILLNFYGLTTASPPWRAADSVTRINETQNLSLTLGYNWAVASSYDYKKAYSDIQRLDLSENSYSIGGNYGVLHEIMSGYSVRQIISAKSIYDQQKATLLVASQNGNVVDLSAIESDLRIKALLIGPLTTEVRKKLLNDLESRSWKIKATYKDDTNPIDPGLILMTK